DRRAACPRAGPLRSCPPWVLSARLMSRTGCARTTRSSSVGNRLGQPCQPRRGSGGTDHRRSAAHPERVAGHVQPHRRLGCRSVEDPLAALRVAYGDLTVLAASLTEEDSWLPTGCRGWVMRDLVLHLLSDAQRGLVALATPSDEPPDRDAVTYWVDAPSGD